MSRLLLSVRNIHNFLAIVYLVLTFSLPRSHTSIKLVVIILLVLFSLVRFTTLQKLKINKDVLIFYISISIIGLFWAFIGFINEGNIIGISDNVRLWFFWSVAYLIILTILLNIDTLYVLNKSLCVSAIIIFIINFCGFLNAFYHLNIIPVELIKRLELFVGIHDGYIQIMSHNIGSLFFITPYLISIYFQSDRSNSKLLTIALTLSIITVVFSGRRALWLVVIMTPYIIYLLGLVTKRLSLIKRKFVHILNLSVLLSPIVIICAVYILLDKSFNFGFLKFLKDAFSSDDVRSIQKVYLINGFKEYTFFGSGFGVGTSYIRNAQEPWLYELTYFQLLFNLGITGCVLFFGLFVAYFIKIISIFRNSKERYTIMFSLIVSFFAFSIGAYSNPYFGSFDFLLILGMVPLVSSFISSK